MMEQVLARAPKPGVNDVIVSHGNPFRALHPESGYLREGEAAIVRPLPGGGQEILARVAWEERPAQ